MEQSVSASATPGASRASWWPHGSWKIMDTQIGIVPIPIYGILVALIAGFTYTGDIKGEVSIMIAVLVIGGFTCAEIGKRTPVLRNIGAAAIFATFIPSALAYYKLLPPQVEKSVVEFTKYTNFLYLFIACIIVGSILGMDRQVLVKGFLKIFVPLAVGSVAAGIVGTLVGTLLGLAAITLYLMGVMCHRLFGLPAPVAMLFLAVIAKLTSAVSPHLQRGGFVVYKFFSTAVTYPLLFAIGVSMTPWDKLIAAFNLPNLITIVSTVATLMATGAYVGRLLGMYPIEAAIINACHSGQGGTGDVAILTAANRMQLMPFAQIATRIGGAITVTTVLILLSRLV